MSDLRDHAIGGIKNDCSEIPTLEPDPLPRLDKLQNLDLYFICWLPWLYLETFYYHTILTVRKVI